MTNKVFFTKEPKILTLDIGDGFFIKVPEIISYKEMQEATKNIQKEGKDAFDIGKEMLVNLIVEWNLTNESGEIAPITKEYIEKLPAGLTEELANIMTPKSTISKKK